MGSRKGLVKTENRMARDKKGRYICLVCPNCCELEMNGPVVEGARCKRGKAFALQETIEPLRVLTTTLRCETERGTRLIPVKTASAIPLAQTREILKAAKELRLTGAYSLGDRLRLEKMPVPVELIVTGE